MNKEDREKLEDVAGFLQGWLAFKKPVPTEEVIKLHFDLVMEVLAKNNEALDLVSISYSDKRKFVKCRNVYKTSWESTTRKVDENCKLHFLSGAEFIYNRILERLPNEC